MITIANSRAEKAARRMGAAGMVFVTPVARVEAAMVMMGRFDWDRATFDRAWQALGTKEVAIDSSIGVLAIDAYELWGRGRAKARPNFGDCFSYALAIARNVPLLYVGDDFAQTDLERA